MKTLLIHDTSPCFGGALTSLYSLFQAIEARGWDAHLVVSNQANYARFLREFKGDASRVRCLPDAHSTWHEGGRYLAREATRAKNLDAHLQEVRPDVVLGNNAPQSNASTLWAAHAQGLPYVQYIRGPYHRSLLSRRLLGQAERVVVVGHDPALQPEGREAVFVPEVLGRWPSPRGADASAWFWCGSMMRWKALDMMLDVYESLPAHRPPLRVCYLPVPPGSPGGGEVPTQWPRGVTAYEDPEALDALRSQCSLYVHTALRPEPFGRSILEAMASGLSPVVPSEGHAEHLVVDGDSGWLYAPRDAGSLRAVLMRAMESPAAVRACGDRARAVALDMRRSAGACGALMRVLEDACTR